MRASHRAPTSVTCPAGDDGGRSPCAALVDQHARVKRGEKKGKVLTIGSPLSRSSTLVSLLDFLLDLLSQLSVRANRFSPKDRSPPLASPSRVEEASLYRRPSLGDSPRDPYAFLWSSALSRCVLVLSSRVVTRRTLCSPGEGGLVEANAQVMALALRKDPNSGRMIVVRLDAHRAGARQDMVPGIAFNAADSRIYPYSVQQPHNSVDNRRRAPS